MVRRSARWAHGDQGCALVPKSEERLRVAVRVPGQSKDRRPRPSNHQPDSIKLAVDLRPFQDPEYSAKGIGLHGRSILASIRRMPDVTMQGVYDPLYDALPDDIRAAFPDISRDPSDFEADVFLNLSPLTHDTATLATAMKAGMRRLAVVHDFIPLRQWLRQDKDQLAKDAAYQTYVYRVRSLDRYDHLLANSSSTLVDIDAVLPEYTGAASTFHCRSRFTALAEAVDPVWSTRLRELLPDGTRYVLVAAADDPRKNVEITLRAAAWFRDAKVRLVIGGGFSEATQGRLRNEHPRAFLVTEPLFLPRLSDAELLAVYYSAQAVVVPSRDEGFSLPVAEAVTLGRRVVASAIPAHAEQIGDPALLFDPASPDDLARALTHALSLDEGPALLARYVVLPYERNDELLEAAIRIPGRNLAGNADTEMVIVGPDFSKPTGLAVYDRLMIAALSETDVPFVYTDVDDLSPAQFYDWLFDHQLSNIVYVMGNNDLFHARCFEAMQNVPGACVLHDSRLFEFLLNRFGPYYLIKLWSRRRKDAAITVRTVENWQAERKYLKDSFLDPVVARATRLIVHNRVQIDHLAAVYGCSKAHYIPFASQMTEHERADVIDRRATRVVDPGEPRLIAMFGETEANKACVEIIFAFAMLRVAGYDARLHFIGRSEGDYNVEMVEAAAAVGVSEFIDYHQYVNRQSYLGWLASIDVAVQLRYPLFGQVSGPVSDAVMCGVPLVTTESLAFGMDVADCCATVPDAFSPLHVSEQIRTLLEAGFAPPVDLGPLRDFRAYVGRLMDIAN